MLVVSEQSGSHAFVVGVYPVGRRSDDKGDAFGSGLRHVFARLVVDGHCIGKSAGVKRRIFVGDEQVASPLVCGGGHGGAVTDKAGALWWQQCGSR